MKTILAILSFFVSCSMYAQESNILVHYSHKMGSTFSITIDTTEISNPSEIISKAEAEANRLEKMISSWDSTSQTSVVNRNAGIKPVKVGEELFQLILRAKKVSQLTDGAFDISYASLDKIWDFKKKMDSLPSALEIRNAVSKINYLDVVLNRKDTTVFLRKEGMKIGFGGIGKGFLSNKIVELLKQEGVQSGIVNSGGDLLTWGDPINSAAWEIGVLNPYFKNSSFAGLNIKNNAVVTSGDYEKFVTIKGKKYAHIINPKTGFPVEHINSVTVICPSAELADALATAIFVLGEKEGIDLVNDLKGIEAIVVKDSTLKVSNGIELKQVTKIYKAAYFYMADAGIVTLCSNGKKYAAELTGGTVDLETSFFKRKQKKRKFYIEFEGEILPPIGESKLERIRVTKILRTWEGKDCAK